MNCMKCGKTTTNEQVFCDVCLQVMAKHPVKPGTPVYLPQRQEEPVVKKTGRRARQLPLEDQVKDLQKRNHRLRLWLLIVGLLFAGIIGLSIWQFVSGELFPGFLSVFKG